MAIATLDEPDVEYPYGTHRWLVNNDTCARDDNAKIRMLSFSTCNETQFNCNEGTW